MAAFHMIDTAALGIRRAYNMQKGLPVEKEDADRLRGQKLVEGRLTSLYLSASAAKIINDSTGYIKNKGFDDQYYKDLIVEYLKQYGKAKKRDIRELLWDKLPDALSDKQKEYKIGNLLAVLKKDNIIDTDSTNQQKILCQVVHLLTGKRDHR